VHLSALRLRGFKSFPEQVELHFFPGVAVIIGPNGSGKSNISDSLQWAMAAGAPSAVRASAGTDVLFAGTDARPAAGVCEVELVLDNSDGSFDLPHGEISVMRRLHRDGSSEYLLGRRAVRRLEVQEALADAGLGRDLHCVISQGSVDEVLLARPEERRALIEEAAGLGKYQRRRRRARARLTRVRADLERASDIEREIGRRLRPLQLQATAAERAEVIGREAAEARLRLLASESATARRRRATLAGERDAARTARNALSQAAAETRTRRERAEGELAGLAAEQERASARAWGLASSLERLSDRRSALRERLSDAGREADREARTALALEQEAETARADAIRAADEAAKLVAEAEHADPTDDDALAAATARAEAALERALAARRTAGDADAAMQRARSELQRAQARVETLTRELETVTRTDAGAQAALGPLAAAVEAAAPTAALARETLARTEQLRVETAEELDRVRALEGERRIEAGAAAAELAGAATRARALEAAVARGDGLAPAVRLLQGRAPLAHELVDPEPGLEAAVAAVLARRAGTAVAADLDAALALLDDAGLEGASVGVPRAHAAGPAAGPGLTPLANRCTLAKGAPKDLLAGAFLADDARALRALRAGIAVTREGLGFDADLGVAFRGGAAGQADALAARRELADALEHERSAAGAHERLQVAVDALIAERSGAEERARVAAAEARTASNAINEAERLERAARDAHERARTDASRLSERRALLEREASALRTSVERASEESVALAAAAASASERASSTDAAHRAIAAERATLAAAAAERRARAATLRERARAAGEEAQRRAVAAERSATAARAARARSELLAGLAGRADSLDAIIAACAEAGERARRPAAESVRSFERRAAELSAELAACGADETARDSELRAADARATTLEVEHAQLDERLSELRRRARELADQHRLTIVDAVEPMAPEDVSALSAKLERLERRRAELGAVNPLAREQYEEERARSEDVSVQIADLRAAVGELDGLIAELSGTIDERFTETFAKVEQGFAEAIETLFPGGRGRLTLRTSEPVAEGDDEQGAAVEADEPGDPGIELEVHPRGKRLTSLNLLSGGERALAALAFLFALAFARPCPFYVLDEVDAALDDANIERFLELVQRERERAQFVIITHQKRTMDVADVLYGVSMAGDGISRVLSRRVPRSEAALSSPNE
jgi:chromosome segregation protein